MVNQLGCMRGTRPPEVLMVDWADVSLPLQFWPRALLEGAAHCNAPRRAAKSYVLVDRRVTKLSEACAARVPETFRLIERA